MPEIYMKASEAEKAAAVIMAERKLNFDIQCAHYAGEDIPRSILSESYEVSAVFGRSTRSRFKASALLYHSKPAHVAVGDGFSAGMQCPEHGCLWAIGPQEFSTIYSAFCPECSFVCGHCRSPSEMSTRIPLGPGYICSQCYSRGVRFCEIHRRNFLGQCRHCQIEQQEANHWRNLKTEENKIEDSKKLISAFGRKPDTIKKKPSGLYRPMVRRANDFRISEMVSKIGKLPVQLCLIGGSHEFMGDYDIIVSQDLKANMPSYNWGGEWATLEIEDRFPKTIAIARHIRESNDLFAKAILWIKDFHA